MLIASGKTQIFEIFHYQRPYRQPLLLKQGRFDEREGLILRQKTPEGYRYGEVAPFPGLQPESITDCITQLKQLQTGQLCDTARFPSVQWGMYQLKETFSPPHKHIPINTLISGYPDPHAFQQAVAQAYTKGYRCFKIKMGLMPRHEEISRIQTLLNTYQDIQLRLDANRSWTYDDFSYFIQSVESSQIEYFEEPFREASEYAKLTTQQWKQIALDESLNCGPTPHSHLAYALVLKPMVLGPRHLKTFLKQAHMHQQKVVFSACFESSWGLSVLARMAIQYAPETPCGLDTNQAFATDIWEPALQAEQGTIPFQQRFFTAQRHHQLQWNTTYIRKID